METNNNHRVLYVIISVILLLIIGVTLYIIFYNPTSNPTINTNNNFPSGRPSSGFPVSTSTSNNDSGQGTNNPNNIDDYYNNIKIATLRKISQDPMAGAVAFLLNGQSYVRFTDKATGHTYETDLQDISLNRITNTTIPKIYESFWSSRGDSVGLRYLNNNEEIQTYWAKIGKVSSSSDLSGTFLPTGVTQFANNPTGDKIFYLLNIAESSNGYITDINLAKKSLILNSPVREWLVNWPKDNTIVFNTKPSAQAVGYVYFLNTSTGSFDKQFGGIYGLTTLYNSDINKVLYSESSEQSIILRSYDSKNKIVNDLSLKTLPEKCVWSNKNKNIAYCAVPKNLPQADYPDAWYQGLISFQDQIWQIDTETGTSKIISSLIGADKNIDAINLALDPTETYLIFTNKSDFQLWSLTLN